MLPPDTSGVQLSPDEVARFARHLILPEVGMEGQKRLKAASVLCVGTGGLGSPLLLYLAAAGVAAWALSISTWLTTAICSAR
jgi:adenylyltransferase/sulfurtransferase